jgi:hypothetical protein
MLYFKMKTRLPAVALAALFFFGLPLASSPAYVGISIGIAPPAIPVYTQPYCPAPGYIWTPGYWAYADFGYYWVPGVWVRPPGFGLLWTPGYWGYNGGRYIFNQGYWGPTVGFYGGINYGYGYGGRGYYGGQWAGNTFRYNTAVTRVNTTVIHNTYVNREVVTKNTTGGRTSFNGPGGVNAKPTQKEQAAAKVKRIPPTATQRSRVEAAKKDPALHAANNKGKPKPEAVKEFHGKHGVEPTAAAAAAGPKGGKQAGVEKNASTARPTSATTRQAGTGKAKSNQAKKAPAPRARSSTQASHNAAPKKAPVAPYNVKNTQPAPRHPQKAASAKKAAPAARSQGAAPTAQNPKQKKKKKGDGQ